MARGQNSKEDAIQKILNIFPGSFIYEKEIRLPYKEDGEDIQLKCALTCAKTNVEQGGENILPGENNIEIPKIVQKEETQPVIQMTQEEKDNIKRLMETFGL